MEHRHIEPDPQATLPAINPSSLEFLYYCYGFLSVEPTAAPEVILGFNTITAYRIVGLERQSTGEQLPYLNSFISSILQGQLPTGHCDLCPTSPPNERFSPLWKTSIYDIVFWLWLPECSEDTVFMCVNTPNNLPLLVVHESLSILRMVRAGTQLQLNAKLQYLLHNGCWFTLLYPHTWPSDPPHFRTLTFPTHNRGLMANAEDFHAYMSGLKTFFLERPYAVAAALCRGGIAWRITWEVLGIEGAIEAVLGAYPDGEFTLNTSQGVHWFHELNEGEWFYLVGGYKLWTGLWPCLKWYYADL